MPVEKCRTPDPVSVTAAPPFSEASRRREEYRIRHLPPLEGGTLALERGLEAGGPDFPVPLGL